jgi:hypothetical protein
MPSLSRDPRLLQLALDLGIPSQGDVVAQIVEYALGRVEEITSRCSVEISTLEALKEVLAEGLSVNLRYVWKNEDFQTIADEFRGSYLGLAHILKQEFAGGDTEGLLLYNSDAAPWERRYVAVIDGRGQQAVRANYTSWHELAHLLIAATTDVSGYIVHSSSASQSQKDPVEHLVDLVAGRIAFYEPIFRPAFMSVLGSSRLNFSIMERIRFLCAPEASLYSLAFACVRLVDDPTLLLKVECISPKNRQLQTLSRLPLSPEFRTAVMNPAYRVVHCYRNDAARSVRLEISKGLQVPDGSAISLVHKQRTEGELTVLENQCWWESDTGPLAPCPLIVRAVRKGDYVYALVSPG